MTGLEPHPIFRLPTQEEARAMGKEKFQALIAARAKRMALEREDPFNNGFEPAIWHLVDDLLVDGKKVILQVPCSAPSTPGAPLNRRADLLNVGVDIPREILGAAEVLCTGSNRSSKSEYAAKKCMKVLYETPNGRGWSFAETGPISIARQQPLFEKYMPLEVKRAMRAAGGKFKQGMVGNVTYGRKNGFTEQTFVLPNGAQHWFKNYAQDIENVEGDQLDVIWLDEGARPELVKTLRFRLGDRGGILIVTFTPIDESYTAIVNEYDKGSRIVLETSAALLPVKVPRGRGSAPSTPGRSSKPERNSAERSDDGMEIVGYEKVPRVKVAGPGSDGNQRANIVYFHITDNPYFGFNARPRPGESVTFGAERFYKMLRGATRAKILSRAYGVATRAAGNQFAKFSEVHQIDPERIPRVGTNYHIVDPCPGRNWFMIWIRVDRRGRRYVYREWPSYGHPEAYIPGIGDIGPWALPGSTAAGKVVHDGVRGPAQNPLSWGLSRYREEILRLEGARRSRNAENGSAETLKTEEDKPLWKRGAKRNPLGKGSIEEEAVRDPEQADSGEKILERWMDSRYGNAPTQTREGSETIISQMEEKEGMTFLAASGKEIGEGVALVNDLLDYDVGRAIGEYSPELNRVNEPLLYVSKNCPNVIYALREWTGKDGQHGACKDPVDTLRYAVLENLDYVGEDAFEWRGGIGVKV